MKSKSLLPQFRIFAAATITICASVNAYAAPVIKHTAGTNLALPAAWTGGVGPAPTVNDVATWNATSLGGNLTVGSAVTWGGINVTGATAGIGITGSQITTGNITLTGNRTFVIANAIALSGNSIYDIGDVTGNANADASFDGIISGVGIGFTKTGAGTLRLLGGSSTYSGGTTLSEGTLSIGASSTGGPVTSGPLGTGTLTLSGGTLNNTTAITIGNTVFVTSSTTTALNANSASNSFTLTGTLTGSGTLANNSSTSANMLVNGDISGFTGTFSYNGITTGNNLRFAGTGSGQDGSQAKFLLSGTTTNGTNTRTLGISSVGTFKMGELSGTGGIISTTTNGQNATLEIGALNTSPAAFAGVIADKIDGTGGVMSLTKVGSTGTLTLSGTNTYTGATTVSGGKLSIASTGSINNTSGVSIGAGEFNYNASTALTKTVSFTGTGGTLSGSGTINSSVNVTSGNTLAIGNSAGTMNFGTNLTIGGTYLYEMDGGTLSADLGNVDGLLTLGGTLDLVQLGTYSLGDKFTLFSYNGTLGGTFDGLAEGDTLNDDLGGLWQIAYDDTAGLNGGSESNFVTITAIPEPAAALLGSLGMLALLRRRRA